MAETIKARPRRILEGFFQEYIYTPGIDIGCQFDPIIPTFRAWDILFHDGDATHMAGVKNGAYRTVYASHVLEHLDDPDAALRNWMRILAPGGHLIVVVPHRDLYEKKAQPPSRWNAEHKHFYLPDRAEPPGVLNFREVIDRAAGAGPGAGSRGSGGEVVSFRVLDAGWTSAGVDVHSGGEYSIEAIIRRAGTPGADVTGGV